MFTKPPKPPVRGPDESFDDFIDRVNKGVSDGPGIFLSLVAIALIAIGFFIVLHH